MLFDVSSQKGMLCVKEYCYIQTVLITKKKNSHEVIMDEEYHKIIEMRRIHKIIR